MLLCCVILFVCSATILGYDYPETWLETTTMDATLEAGEKRMSEYILEILDHYKQADPLGLPGLRLPEPYHIPDTKFPNVAITVHLKNASFSGINTFRIVYVDVEIASMTVKAQLMIDELQARGTCTTSTLFSWADEQSPFTSVVTGLRATAFTTLAVERDGKVRAQDINIDLRTSNLVIIFDKTNAVFQSVINFTPALLFNYIKPYILKEARPILRAEINKRVSNLPGYSKFPNSISPFDIVVADLRKIVRNKKYDPFKIEDYEHTVVNVLTINLTNTWIMGLSSFQRDGNITLQIENNTVVADLKVGTQVLKGDTQWNVFAVRGLLSKAGTASFSVEYISARIILAQPLDTREKPEFRDLDLEIGNIQVRCNGASTVDYVVELALNILPNLLRYQIMNALEGLIKHKLQDEFNEFDTQEAIKQLLPKIDDISENGLTAAATKEVHSYDEDEFFNF